MEWFGAGQWIEFMKLDESKHVMLQVIPSLKMDIFQPI